MTSLIPAEFRYQLTEETQQFEVLTGACSAALSPELAVDEADGGVEPAALWSILRQLVGSVRRRSPPGERSDPSESDRPHEPSPAHDPVGRPMHRRWSRQERHPRCLKRFVALEVLHRVMFDHNARTS